jgi:hypothetical protein
VSEPITSAAAAFCNDARLTSAKYAKPYRKGQKNDFRDLKQSPKLSSAQPFSSSPPKQPIIVAVGEVPLFRLAPKHPIQDALGDDFCILTLRFAQRQYH